MVWAECRSPRLGGKAQGGHGGLTIGHGGNRGNGMDTTITLIGFGITGLLVGIAILGFLWNLHRDIADLRERMARLEGLFQGFTGRTQPTQ